MLCCCAVVLMTAIFAHAVSALYTYHTEAAARCITPLDKAPEKAEKGDGQQRSLQTTSTELAAAAMATGRHGAGEQQRPSTAASMGCWGVPLPAVVRTAGLS